MPKQPAAAKNPPKHPAAPTKTPDAAPPLPASTEDASFVPEDARTDHELPAAVHPETPAVRVFDEIMEAIETIEKCYERAGAISGLSSGFREFDRLTDGLHPSEMIVIAGRPSMGKSAWAMNVAEHVAATAKQGVAIFSLQMDSQQYTQRLMCSRAKVNLARVREGFLTERDFPNLTNAAGALAHCPIFIDDTPRQSLLELSEKARLLKRNHDIKLIIIDHLHLLHATDDHEVSQRSYDRHLEMCEISRGIKALAKELKVPIIVLAPLSREVEKRTGGEPTLNDLRGSGSIEDEADLIGLLTRAEFYAGNEQEREEIKNTAELFVVKHRNGPPGTVTFRFQKEYTRFEDLAQSLPPPPVPVVKERAKPGRAKPAQAQPAHRPPPAEWQKG